jgi:hypothetical protein
MFWVKDCDSDLVNIEQATDIRIKDSDPDNPGRYQVRAYWNGTSYDGSALYTVIFKGNRKECGRYRDDLFRKLTEHRDSSQA